MISRVQKVSLNSRNRSRRRASLRVLGLAGLCALAVATAPALSAACDATSASASSSAPLVAPAVMEAAPTESAAAPAQQLEDAVHNWIESLSAQKSFAEWKQASPTIEALGPGTHGWLVTMRLSDGRPVGYMVVYAAEDGTFRLGEYGTGPQPLFDAAALSRSLIANGFISESTPAFKADKLYLHPFAAVWKVEVNGQTYWLDAKTDEILPLDDEQWDMLVQAAFADSQAQTQPFPEQPGSQDNEKIAASRLNEAFDPFERLSWLMNEKPFSVKNENTLLTWLNKNKQLRYISEPFGDRMMYALAVIGYERWSGGRIDVALDNEGTRFVPLTALQANGLFYR